MDQGDSFSQKIIAMIATIAMIMMTNAAIRQFRNNGHWRIVRTLLHVVLAKKH